MSLNIAYLALITELLEGFSQISHKNISSVWIKLLDAVQDVPNFLNAAIHKFLVFITSNALTFPLPLKELQLSHPVKVWRPNTLSQISGPKIVTIMEYL